MRGRTLDKAFVILDEVKMLRTSQMKMFLTRMGTSAKFIITGDDSQIDLPKHQKSGLIQVKSKLENIEGISFIFLDDKDVIRHKLVKQIIKAYKKIKTMSNSIKETKFNLPNQTKFYKGKVRDVYTIGNDLLVMIVSDRISAFDVVLPEGIPYKGQVLSQIKIEVFL